MKCNSKGVWYRCIYILSRQSLSACSEVPRLASRHPAVICSFYAADCSYLFCNLLNIPLCHFCICLSVCSCFSSSGISLTASLCVFDSFLVSRWTSLSFFWSSSSLSVRKGNPARVCVWWWDRFSRFRSFFIISLSPGHFSLCVLPADSFDYFVLLFGRLPLRLPQHLCICFCHKYHGNHFTPWWLTHMSKVIGWNEGLGVKPSLMH